MKALLLSSLLLVAAAIPAAAQSAAVSGPIVTVEAARAATPAERLNVLRGLTDSPTEPLARTLARQLQSGRAALRADGLRETVYYATHFGDLVDFTPLVPSLLAVVERDPDPAHRVMASQALCKIGDREALLEMSRLAQRDRDRLTRKRILYAAAATLEGMK